MGIAQMSATHTDTDKELEAVLGSHKTIIRIVGTGGAGNNTVSRLLEVGAKDVDIIAVNTDAQDLLYAKAGQKVLIGRNITSGLGAGSDPLKGEESAKESHAELEAMLEGSDMVFITCGLGGGTGTGSAPVIAQIAKKVGALAIAVVTLPFNDEGVVRWDNARKGLDSLQNSVDTVIVVQNDKLLDLVPDLPLTSAFKVADEILVNAVRGITELVTEKGLVNLDFADVRTIMKDGGLAMIGIGESENDMNAEQAATKALENPLLDVDITGAQSALINITGGQELSLKAAKTVMKIVADKLDSSAKIIWGARLDESMGNSLRVMLIVTCLQPGRRSASEIERALNRDTIPAGPVGMAMLGSATGAEKKESQQPADGSDELSPLSASKKQKASKVFSDIFMEESDTDITLLEDAIKGLVIGKRTANEKHFREIKNACRSIYSSAELFGYMKIVEFSELVEEITQCALNDEFDFPESFLDLLRQIPPTLRDMVAGEPIADQKADEIKRKFENLLESLTDEAQEEPVTGRESASRSHEGTDIPDEEHIDANAEKSEEGAGPQEGGKEDANFSTVREAVKYFDRLF